MPVLLFDNASAIPISEHGSPESDPDVLWHYTTGEGALGIIGKNTLRFGEASFMNDGSEVKHGYDLFNTELDELIEGKEDEFRHFADTLRPEFLSYIQERSPVIFCLCEEGNLLNQWRDYGRDVVPYSLGFDRAALEEIGKSNFEFHLFPIIYDLDKQKRIIRETLNAIYESYKQFEFGRDFSDEERAETMLNACAEIGNAVVRFKNPAFSAEREWRLFVHLQKISRYVKPEFRVSRLGVTPYYTFIKTEVDQRLPIVRAYVGPSPYIATSVESFAKFLRANNYNDVDIQPSEIPIRL